MVNVDPLIWHTDPDPSWVIINKWEGITNLNNQPSPAAVCCGSDYFRTRRHGPFAKAGDAVAVQVAACVVGSGGDQGAGGAAAGGARQAAAGAAVDAGMKKIEFHRINLLGKWYNWMGISWDED